MKYWAKTLIDNRRVREYTYDAGAPFSRKDAGVSLGEVMSEIAKELDIERPVITNKHIRELTEFNRVVFLPQDFIDGVDFDRLVVEVYEDNGK